MASFTLSNIESNFAKDASLLGEMSPYLDFEFGHHTGHRSVFKTTMVKGGGVNVRWTQPVLLTGTGGTNLRVVAKAHKSLGKDKTIGHGTIDLAAAASSGLTTVPLESETGKAAGQVRFNVTRGEGAGVQGQATPAAGGVVENLGGTGHALDGPGGVGTAAGTGGGGMTGVGANQGYGAGPGIASDHGGIGAGVVPGSTGGPAGGMGGPGMGGAGMGGGPGNAMGGPGGAGYQNQQMVPGGQQGGAMVGGQQGGMGGMQQGGMQQGGMQQGGMGQGGQGPQEHFEKRTHNLHDHNESETSEVRHVG